MGESVKYIYPRHIHIAYLFYDSIGCKIFDKWHSKQRHWNRIYNDIERLSLHAPIITGLRWEHYETD